MVARELPTSCGIIIAFLREVHDDEEHILVNGFHLLAELCYLLSSHHGEDNLLFVKLGEALCVEVVASDLEFFADKNLSHFLRLVRDDEDRLELLSLVKNAYGGS